MPKVKSPAFQFYPSDFLADAKTLVMTAEEIGAYWLLVCVCWNECGLPDEEKSLARLARTQQKKFTRSWKEKISQCFIFDPETKLWQHPRLTAERQKQASYKDSQSQKGKQSAQKRQDEKFNRGSIGLQPDVKSLAVAVASSSSLTTTTATTPKKHGVVAVAAAAAVFDDEALISEFQNEAVYNHLDIRFVMGKMIQHCREKKVEPTRSRFIGWLNRENPANAKPKGGRSNDESITQSRLQETADRYRREDEEAGRNNSEVEDRLRLSRTH